MNYYEIQLDIDLFPDSDEDYIVKTNPTSIELKCMRFYDADEIKARIFATQAVTSKAGFIMISMDESLDIDDAKKVFLRFMDILHMCATIEDINYTGPINTIEDFFDAQKEGYIPEDSFIIPADEENMAYYYETMIWDIMREYHLEEQINNLFDNIEKSNRMRAAKMLVKEFQDN